MDSPPGTSSHHSKHESSKRRESNGFHNGESRHHRRKHGHHRSSRSRSSSVESKSKRAYINPSPKFNFFNWDKSHGRTPSEYEVRIQALNTQLSMAQTQITGLEAQIHGLRQHGSQLEHQLYAAQQENLTMTNRNAEILSVMKTLEAGVESLQKEQDTLKFDRDNLKHKVDSLHKEKIVMSDQISYLNERNSTLSKKCVDLLEGGKTSKEKLEKCENELISLRPHTEALEKKFKELDEQHRNFLAKISTFEAREKVWTNEKLAMEQRIKDLLAADKRTQEEIRQLKLKEIAAATAVAAMQNTSCNMDTMMDGVEAEHLRVLSTVVESLHAHHQTEMNRTRLKLEMLSHGRLSL